MPRLRCHFAVLLAGVVALLTTSCSGRLSVYPVHGSIKSGDKPAARAVIVLHPLEELALKSLLPHGRAEADGSFKISTYIEGDGAPPGEYALTIVWPRVVKQDGEDADGDDLLKGQFSTVEHPFMKVTIKEGDNELPAIQIPKP